MKTRLLATLALLTATATASADVYDASEPAPQKDRYLAVTTSGGASDSAFRLGIGAEGGYRIASSPWFVHAQADTGLSGSLYGRGRFTALRGGIEARQCVGYATRLCGLAGADGGLMMDTFTVAIDDAPMPSSSAAAMVVPRVGVEIGSQVRLRAIVEAPLYVGPDPETGINVALGLGYAF